ncbi:hypothetical protein I8Q49_20815 [Acinetobacter baumannii]|nr:hypothetical protein [Acinetobacter baumannii]
MSERCQTALCISTCGHARHSQMPPMMLTASNSASGVGVKLTYGNNPGAAVPDGTSVKINEASNLPILNRVTGASAGTAEAINFHAQYVQTDATVGAGTANSMVTFALEYN